MKNTGRRKSPERRGEGQLNLPLKGRRGRRCYLTYLEETLRPWLTLL